MSDAIAPRVRDMAIDWIVRLQSGVMTAAEHEALQRWRQANEAHEQAWQRVACLPLLQQPGAHLLHDATARQALQCTGPDPQLRRQVLKRLLVLGVVGSAAWEGADTTALQAVFANYRTRTGERRQWTLPDGSSLWLNTASAINLDFTAQVREVRMVEGELFLGTAPVARGLQLTTPDAMVITDTAQFQVRHDGRGSLVTIVKGQAQLHSLRNQHVLVLKAGWQVRVGRDGIAEPQRADAAFAQAWLRGVLPAERMRLDELLGELSRYRPGILRCHEQVATLRLTGSFSLENTDAALTLIKRSLPVRIERLTRYWVTVVPA
jgi:transmembrane sensor